MLDVLEVELVDDELPEAQETVLTEELVDELVLEVLEVAGLEVVMFCQEILPKTWSAIASARA